MLEKDENILDSLKNENNNRKINKNIIKPSNNLLEFAAGQYDDPKYKLGEHEWPALKRMLKKNNSIYDQ